MSQPGRLPHEREALLELETLFAEQFKHLDVVLDAALAIPNALIGKRISFPQGSELDTRVLMVTFSLYTKAIKTHRGIGLLTRHGLGQDALATCRILFETAVAIGFLLERDHQERTALYEAHESYRHFKMADAWSKLPVSKGDPEVEVRLRIATEQFEALKARVGEDTAKKAERHWSGENLRTTCERIGLLPLYDVLFRYASLAVHAADGPLHVTLQSNAIGLHLIPGKIYVKEAIGYANQLLLFAARFMNGTFDAGCGSVLEEASTAVFGDRPAWFVIPRNDSVGT